MTNSNYSRNTNLFKSVFLAIVVIYLTALVSGFESLTFAMKPLLLLPLLMLVMSSKGIVGKTLLVLALCFSWAGDTLLLLVYKSSIFFLLGLAAFMLAHILYIVLFRLKAPYKAISTKWNVALLSLIGLYLVILLYILNPGLGEMKIPVMVYAVVISYMLLNAVWASRAMQSRPANQLILGAVSFVVSDSILAINKFHTPFDAASFLIMVTYLFAQYSIVSAWLSSSLDEVVQDKHSF